MSVVILLLLAYLAIGVVVAAGMALYDWKNDCLDMGATEFVGTFAAIVLVWPVVIVLWVAP